MNSEKSSKANLINGANYHHRMDSIHRNISFDLLRVVNKSFKRQILNLDSPKQNFATKNVSFLKFSAHKWECVFLLSFGRRCRKFDTHTARLYQPSAELLLEK